MVSKYTSEDSSSNILTTELNSLADGANKITGTALSNDASAERDLFATFRLALAAQGSARSSGAYVAMYFLPDENGTFAFGGDSLDPAEEHLVWRFSYDAATTARSNVSAALLLPPTDFHVLLINETGQAFASSSNVLSYQRLDGGYEDA